MKQSESINGLLKSLCALQAEIPTMPKDTDGYGYKYTNLDTIVATIKPLLAKHNIGYIQPITTTCFDGMKPCTAITTRIFNADGEYIEDTAILPEITVGKTNAAQNMGAAITYMRRYALCSMLGITSDEDVDGNAQMHQAMQQNRGQAQRRNAPGGADTAEERETINKLLHACDDAGNPLFNSEDFKTVGNLRKTDTAQEIIRKLQYEINSRTAARKKAREVASKANAEAEKQSDAPSNEFEIF